jgi:hypothetical protein
MKVSTLWARLRRQELLPRSPRWAHAYHAGEIGEDALGLDAPLGRSAQRSPFRRHLLKECTLRSISFNVLAHAASVAATATRGCTDADGRSVVTRLVELAIKGGDIAATTAGIVDDVKHSPQSQCINR